MSSAEPKNRMTEIGDESRQRILDAAEKLFLEKGYNGTTIVEVGKLSGISYGSIPWHFENKKGLLVAVILRLWSNADANAPLEPGVEGLELVLTQMEQWDNSPFTPLMNSLAWLEFEFDSTWYLEVARRDNERHEVLARWILETLDGRPIPGGLSADSVARFWTASSRGIFTQKALLQGFPDGVRPRDVLRQSIISLLGIER
jgi:AcrR family transcriptional regulator